MRRKQIGLYIHIPFCKRKCSYCDFCSYAEKQDLISKYIKCLLQEIKEVGTYTAVIKLHREVKVDVQFEVVSE